ncbi:MAG: hypothetical protein AVDCRST_MAG77-4824, partial [uncultured Chloroflexi bacterium]
GATHRWVDATHHATARPRGHAQAGRYCSWPPDQSPRSPVRQV